MRDQPTVSQDKVTGPHAEGHVCEQRNLRAGKGNTNPYNSSSQRNSVLQQKVAISLI